MRIKYSVEIEENNEVVFDSFSDISKWQLFTPDIKDARWSLSEPWQEKSVFFNTERFPLFGEIQFESKVYRIQKGLYAIWVSRNNWIVFEYNVVFEPLDATRCKLVVTEIPMTFLTSILYLFIYFSRRKQLIRKLEGLKRAFTLDVPSPN